LRASADASATRGDAIVHVFLGAANPETARMISALQRVDPRFRVKGFIDNDPFKKGMQFVGYPVFGGFEVLPALIASNVRFVNLITGSTRVRFETTAHLARQGCVLTNFIHPSVNLDLTSIGTGNYVQEAVILQAHVTVGNNSSLHMGALVGHESVIGHSVFIAHAVSISGAVTIGDGTFVGTNATILPRLRIGRWATIGAGAVVTRDVPDYATVVGNPARIIKHATSGLMSGDPLANDAP
jgi:sugar O-acyltransferase (sialic acid O-acetyltransferase NeuD family)